MAPGQLLLEFLDFALHVGEFNGLLIQYIDNGLISNLPGSIRISEEINIRAVR